MNEARLSPTDSNAERRRLLVNLYGLLIAMAEETENQPVSTEEAESVAEKYDQLTPELDGLTLAENSFFQKEENASLEKQADDSAP